MGETATFFFAQYDHSDQQFPSKKSLDFISCPMLDGACQGQASQEGTTGMRASKHGGMALADAFCIDEVEVTSAGYRDRISDDTQLSPIYELAYPFHDRHIRMAAYESYGASRLTYNSYEMVMTSLKCAATHYGIRISKPKVESAIREGRICVSRDRGAKRNDILLLTSRNQLQNVIGDLPRANHKGFAPLAAQAGIMTLATDGSLAKWNGSNRSVRGLGHQMTGMSPQTSKRGSRPSPRPKVASQSAVAPSLAQVSADAPDLRIADDVYDSPHAPYILYAVSRGALGIPLFDASYRASRGLPFQAGLAHETILGIKANKQAVRDLALIDIPNMTCGEEEEDKTRSRRSAPVTVRDVAPSWNIAGSMEDFVRMFGRYSKTDECDTFTGVMAPSYLDAPCKYGRGGVGNGLWIELHGQDIWMRYDWSRDTRPDKGQRVPRALRRNRVVVAKWTGMADDFNAKANGGGLAINQPKDRESEELGMCDCTVFTEPISWDDALEGLRAENGWFKFDPGTTLKEAEHRWHYSLRITQAGIKHFFHSACVVEDGTVYMAPDYYD